MECEGEGFLLCPALVTDLKIQIHRSESYGSEFPMSQSFLSQIMGDLYEKCMIINYSKMVEMGQGDPNIVEF